QPPGRSVPRAESLSRILFLRQRIKDSGLLSCVSCSCVSWSCRLEQRRLRLPTPVPLVIDEPCLAVETAAVSCERPGRTDHAMTGDDDRDRIRAVCGPHGA